MRRLVPALLATLLLAVPALAVEQPERSPEEALARVQEHLRVVDDLTQHFQAVLSQECPRFASPAEWKTYLDGEIERVVLLLAHLEEAWIEAKHTGDDDVRRTAKAPRKRIDDAQALVNKLQACANGNGTSFSEGSVWRRIEREVPERQADIALPQ